MQGAARIAVVTGGNRGIGLETCRQLARHGLRVVLGARDEAAGERAAKALRGEGLDVVFHPLDVTDHDSHVALARFLAEEYGRLDVLVNNAGVLPEGLGGGASALSARPELLRATFETNAIAPLMLAKELAPLLRRAEDACVVNVSSGMGQLSEMGGGWPAYRISKAALNAVTRLLAAELEEAGVRVNSACPGWVRTDMGGPSAERSVEQGADTIVWLATSPEATESGGFYRDRQRIEW